MGRQGAAFLIGAGMCIAAAVTVFALAPRPVFDACPAVDASWTLMVRGVPATAAEVRACFTDGCDPAATATATTTATPTATTTPAATTAGPATSRALEQHGDAWRLPWSPERVGQARVVVLGPDGGTLTETSAALHWHPVGHAICGARPHRATIKL